MDSSRGAIFTIAAVRQLVPTLYALGDTRTPVVVSALDSVAFVAMAVGLRGPFGHVGVSMAIGGSTAIQMLLLFGALRRRLGTLRAREIGESALPVLGASVVAALAGRTAALVTGRIPTASPSLALALPGLVGAGVFAVVYVVAARALRCAELAEVTAPLRRLRRLRRG